MKNRGIDYDRFCRRCKNYEFNLEQGTLCSLMHQKPSFEGNCMDFVLDREREATFLAKRTNETEKNPY